MNISREQLTEMLIEAYITGYKHAQIVLDTANILNDPKIMKEKFEKIHDEKGVK